jgi:hypothetical protein
VNRTRIWMCLFVGLIAVAVALGADEAKKPKGVFSALKVGQPVSLKDEGSAYGMTFFEPELPQAHNVVEIGDNFVVLRDIAEVTEISIPIYAVKSVVKVKTKAQ